MANNLRTLRLSKSEEDIIRSKKILVPSRIGPYVIHSHHAGRLLKILGLLVLIVVGGTVFSTYVLHSSFEAAIMSLGGTAFGVFLIATIFCGIMDAITVRKLKKFSGQTVDKMWSEEDIAFWKRVARRRGFDLDDYISFE